jgi:predicted nucleic acid-binding protein
LSYLLDTNVISELRRQTPDEGVARWLAQRSPATLYLSVLNFGEIRKDVEAAATAERRQALTDWLETDLQSYFSGRILPVNHAVADRWGQLLAQAKRPLPAIDGLLAATAIVHQLVLVTRHVNDFAGLQVEIFNPWQTEL